MPSAQAAHRILSPAEIKEIKESASGTGCAQNFKSRRNKGNKRKCLRHRLRTESEAKNFLYFFNFCGTIKKLQDNKRVRRTKNFCDFCDFCVRLKTIDQCEAYEETTYHRVGGEGSSSRAHGIPDGTRHDELHAVEVKRERGGESENGSSLLCVVGEWSRKNSEIFGVLEYYYYFCIQNQEHEIQFRP